MSKTGQKISLLTTELNSLNSQKDEKNTKISNLNIQLGKLEEPLLKLNDDKIAIQKKLDQKIIERCSKYLTEKGDVDIQYIMEHLVGILKGESRSYSFWVERYLKSIEGLNLALNNIQYSAQNQEYIKGVLDELLGEIAISLGLVTGTDG